MSEIYEELKKIYMFYTSVYKRYTQDVLCI